MHEQLKAKVCAACKGLVEHGLVKLCWGNVSQIDRAEGIVAIKPSGVEYSSLCAEDISIVDAATGELIEGKKPSSDTPTHLELYRCFENVGGIVHTHSTAATAWAQAHRALPCFGTTHADCFFGKVPCTRDMTQKEIENDYELNTAKVIVEKFKRRDYSQVGAVLVASHGAFCWGADAAAALENAVVLEECALMGLYTVSLEGGPISRELLKKHFLRKHGKDAYYGQ